MLVPRLSANSQLGLRYRGVFFFFPLTSIRVGQSIFLLILSFFIEFSCSGSKALCSLVPADSFKDLQPPEAEIEEEG